MVYGDIKGNKDKLGETAGCYESLLLNSKSSAILDQTHAHEKTEYFTHTWRSLKDERKIPLSVKDSLIYTTGFIWGQSFSWILVSGFVSIYYTYVYNNMLNNCTCKLWLLSTLWQYSLINWSLCRSAEWLERRWNPFLPPWGQSIEFF